MKSTETAAVLRTQFSKPCEEYTAAEGTVCPNLDPDVKLVALAVTW